VARPTVSLHTRQRHIEVILGLFRYQAHALDELDAGQVVDDDEVFARIDSWGSENERKPPR
jgi:hypothetical protein